jgi:hypothetical protein
MHSLKDNFDTLCLRIRDGRRLESTGSAPIYYLVFAVDEILEVKRQSRAWVAKLKNQGWNVVTFSFAEALNKILQEHKLRKTWLMGESLLRDKTTGVIGSKAVEEINKTIGKVLTEGNELLSMIRVKVQAAGQIEHGLLLLTDLEALHPYLRINSIEAQIQHEVRSPVVVFYPGKREGKTSLRFLEFYPADPNYRSEHIG